MVHHNYFTRSPFSIDINIIKINDKLGWGKVFGIKKFAVLNDAGEKI